MNDKFSIRWRKSGYGYKAISFRGRGRTVQIWWGDRVIDRALTIKRALEKIRDYEAKGPLFVEELRQQQ